MVRHPAADDDRFGLSLGRLSGLPIIAAFIKSKFADPAELGDAMQVGQRGLPLKWHREERRIGRDHRAVVRTRGKGQSRNAEGVILVMPVLVPGAVGRLRDSPWDMRRTHMSALGINGGPQ